jgi:hypothetical protein
MTHALLMWLLRNPTTQITPLRPDFTSLKSSAIALASQLPTGFPTSSFLIQPPSPHFSSVPYSPPRKLHRAVARSLVAHDLSVKSLQKPHPSKQLFTYGQDESGEEDSTSSSFDSDEIDDNIPAHGSAAASKSDISTDLVVSQFVLPEFPLDEGVSRSFLAESAIFSSSRPKFGHQPFVRTPWPENYASSDLKYSHVVNHQFLQHQTELIEHSDAVQVAAAASLLQPPTKHLVSVATGLAPYPENFFAFPLSKLPVSPPNEFADSESCSDDKQ